MSNGKCYFPSSFSCHSVRPERRFRCNRISSKKKKKRRIVDILFVRFFNFDYGPTTTSSAERNDLLFGCWFTIYFQLKADAWELKIGMLKERHTIFLSKRWNRFQAAFLKNSHYSVTWPKGSKHFYSCCRYHVFISLLNNAWCCACALCRCEESE